MSNIEYIEFRYPENTDMSSFERIDAASGYNHNYYINGKDLLFCWSDDDNMSEWYLIVGSQQPIYLGTTMTSQGDKYLSKSANT